MPRNVAINAIDVEMRPHFRMRLIALFISIPLLRQMFGRWLSQAVLRRGALSNVSCSLQGSILIIARPDKFIMSIGTPFHERTFALCESLNYREWSGYYTVSAYETHHDHEYNAIRNAAALIDISPLFKYRVTGRDATRLVDRIITRDVSKVAVGQVVYTPWCDEQGKVIDDGTIQCLAEDSFRWTAADPTLRWIAQNALGMKVEIEDISETVSALALQGPTSGRLLNT